MASCSPWRPATVAAAASLRPWPSLLGSQAPVSRFITRVPDAGRNVASSSSRTPWPAPASALASVAQPGELAGAGKGSASPLPLAELSALVNRIKVEGDAPKEAIDWMTTTLQGLEQQQRDREALMKRSWSDTAFEDGEAGNDNTIEGFERELVGMLKRSREGLNSAEVLGSAIDLAGAYKKNYRLDQSEAVLLRCTRHAERRSGAWMVKYLNHISQVRMKQRRNAESLEMMYEIESLANFPMGEPGASEFYETLYRNMSSCLRSMSREDEAAVYFMKMAEAARYHKKELDWMDLWDLGILMANRAFHAGRWSEFYKSREIIADALQRQRAVEPDEFIMRAKVLSNLGQCYLATDELEEAEVHYSEAYDLFNTTVGKRSPLFGMQAWACGNLRCAEGRHREAVPLLGEALFVEVVGDGLSVSEITKLLDQILMCIHEWRGLALDAPFSEHEQGADAAELEPVRRSLATLAEDPRWEELEDTLELAIMNHKAALLHLAARWGPDALSANSAASPGAAVASLVPRGRMAPAQRYSSRAVEGLRRITDAGGKDAQQWLAQAEAVHSVLAQPREGGGLGHAGGRPAAQLWTERTDRGQPTPRPQPGS